MTSGIEVRELPEWINLGALTTPEEIAQRERLAARGMELLPALETWIRDSAWLAERPPLLEVVDETRELIYSHMGITSLAGAVAQFRELVAVFEASGAELDDRVNGLRVIDDRANDRTRDSLVGRGPDESGIFDGGDPDGVIGEGAGTSKWRHRR